MAQLNDLIVTGSSRFLNTIQGTAASANALTTPVGSSTSPVYIGSAGTPVAINLAGASVSSAASAAKLSTNAGGAGTPIYFTGGVPTNCTLSSIYVGRATADESGNNIKTNYASSLSISDHTITLKSKSGANLASVTVPDSNTIDVLQGTYTIPVAGATAGLKQYSLFAQDANGKYSSFTTQNGTAVSKTVNRTDYFDISKIYYCSTGGNYATNANIGTSIVRWVQPLVDLRYTLNIATNALTARKPLYLKFDALSTSMGTEGRVCYKLAGSSTTDWWTQTLPAADAAADGIIYVKVSEACYDGYRADLSIKQKYFYINGIGFGEEPGFDAIRAIKSDNSIYADSATYATNAGNAASVNNKAFGSASTCASSAFAAASHGVHVPATVAATNKKYLLCNNTWATITSADITSFSNAVAGVTVNNATNASKVNNVAFGSLSTVSTITSGMLPTHTHTTANITSFNSAVDARITRDKVLGVVSSGCSWTGSYAFVEGNGTTASGDYSHAEGTSAVASSAAAHAEGYQTTACNDYAHAEGYLTMSTGYASHTEGDRTTASKGYAHAEGQKTSATNTCSHAEGALTTASGKCAHAEGSNNIASAQSSHAEGDSCTASALYAHAEGYASKASGQYSHAEGYKSTANDSGAHSEGFESVASNSAAHAEGYTTTASGWHSHTEGRNTIASGWDSHAEGYATSAASTAAHAGGYYTIANADYQTAIGKYNSTVANALFIVGKGTATNARSNAMYVTTAGELYTSWLNGTVRSTPLSDGKFNRLVMPPYTTGSQLYPLQVEYGRTLSNSGIGTFGVLTNYNTYTVDLNIALTRQSNPYVFNATISYPTTMYSAPSFIFLIPRDKNTGANFRVCYNNGYGIDRQPTNFPASAWTAGKTSGVHQFYAAAGNAGTAYVTAIIGWR